MAILGFIGTGNMGGALARAACKSIPGDQVLLSNRTPEKARVLAEELGCQAVDNATVAERADLIFLGVKPQYMAGLLSDIGPVLDQREKRFILVSMAAGLTIPRIRELAGKDYPVIRIMPNTPPPSARAWCSTIAVRMSPRRINRSFWRLWPGPAGWLRWQTI